MTKTTGNGWGGARPNSGGKREGAGRPKRPGNPPFPLRVPEDQLAAYRALDLDLRAEVRAEMGRVLARAIRRASRPPPTGAEKKIAPC